MDGCSRNPQAAQEVVWTGVPKTLGPILWRMVFYPPNIVIPHPLLGLIIRKEGLGLNLVIINCIMNTNGSLVLII